MSRGTSRSRKWLVLFVVSVACASASVLILARLPYSTSWITRVEKEEGAQAPGAELTVGPVRWLYAVYQQDQRLDGFREAFGKTCGQKRGIDAARCVSDYLNARSPKGEPVVEFVDAAFDPAEALRHHLAGAPGHCTAKSSMAATALLALGVPARLVQVLPTPPAQGHNVLEVWDPAQGWALFDPYFDSAYLSGSEFVSSVTMSEVSGGLRWRRPHPDSWDPNRFAGSTIHYPEPWLYTRVGERCAKWPFRACFAQLGPGGFFLGPAQRLAFFSALGFAVLGAVGLLVGVWHWRAARVPRSERVG